MHGEEHGNWGRRGGIRTGGLGLPLSGKGSDGGYDECDDETGDGDGNDGADADQIGDYDDGGCVMGSMGSGQREAESAGGGA